MLYFWPIIKGLREKLITVMSRNFENFDEFRYSFIRDIFVATARNWHLLTFLPLGPNRVLKHIVKNIWDIDLRP